MDGVWPEPVSEHVMMTFCWHAISTSRTVHDMNVQIQL
jgi:hypothetical protein